MSEMFLPLMLYVINSILGGVYMGCFLQRKYAKKFTLAVWGAGFFAAQVIIFEIVGSIYPVGEAVGIIVNILVLFILNLFLYRKDTRKQAFVVFSFMAGKEIVKYIASVFVAAVGKLWNVAFYHFTVDRGLDSVEAFHAWEKISVLVIGIAGALPYALLLGIYLFLISRQFFRKDYPLKTHEITFLLLPCVTALCIGVSLKMMIVSIENGMAVMIYDTVPATNFWIPLICLLLLSAIISCVTLFQKLVQYHEENEKRVILENQVEQMQREVAEIQDIYADMRGLKHDMRSHLANILILAGKGEDAENGELKKYIGEMENTIDRLDFAYQTGNPITDIIIHQKKQEADKKQIRFDIRFSYPKELHIDVYDIAVVLNNALENAIEACHDMQTNQYIRLYSYVRGNLFFIEVENTFSQEITIAEESGLPVSSKEQREAHGIGISNIQRCARKYMGDIDIVVTDTDEGKMFNLTVMMNGKQLEAVHTQNGAVHAKCVKI